jgi:N-hydroxyarylamine O-acetyltransferase
VATKLPPALVERVLENLGLERTPDLDLVGLSSVYHRWCRAVPFDNVRKRIALVESQPGPLPGDDPTDFFEGWLAHGTGGTCWAGNGALHALLRAVGFDARRGVGTMLHTSDADLPPNHGTVTVEFDGRRYLVDASLLHDRPLELIPGTDTRIEHGAWGVRVRWMGQRLVLRWHPLRVETLDCRVETLDSAPGEFERRHEMARTRSGFNFQLTARTLRGDDVQAVVMGDWMIRTSSGDQRRAPLQGQDRMEFLTGVLGLSEEISQRMPPDDPVPEHLRRNLGSTAGRRGPLDPD